MYKLDLDLKAFFSAVERPYWQKDDLNVLLSGVVC